jgi:hypothetical protein
VELRINWTPESLLYEISLEARKLIRPSIQKMSRDSTCPCAAAVSYPPRSTPHTRVSTLPTPRARPLPTTPFQFSPQISFQRGCVYRFHDVAESVRKKRSRLDCRWLVARLKSILKNWGIRVPLENVYNSTQEKHGSQSWGQRMCRDCASATACNSQGNGTPAAGGHSSPSCYIRCNLSIPKARQWPPKILVRTMRRSRLDTGC